MKFGLIFVFYLGIVYDCISDDDMEGFILYFFLDIFDVVYKIMGVN